MANGIELAKAYVQIVPTTQGIQGELNSALTDAGEKAGQKGGSGIASGIGSAIGGITKVATAGIAAAASGVGALTKGAVESYASYEQLAGGVETLFKSSSDAVLKYANEAYSAAGLSANDYLDTVTSFSASLIQATGRGTQQNIEELQSNFAAALKLDKRQLEDEHEALKKSWDERLKIAKEKGDKNYELLKSQRDQELKGHKRYMEDQLDSLKRNYDAQIKAAEEANSASVTTEESLAVAAEAANRAIIDMSDNANKMGTDMTSIQNAYQGFAKQNYTMLDNLKLGYGGTKEEMERLIHDAAQMTDVQDELNLTVEDGNMSFDNIINAISVMQKNLGIAGATSEEAMGTIEGSINMTKSAWANLVTSLGTGQGISEALDGLMTSLFGDGTEGSGLMANILPRIQTVFGSIGQFIAQAAPILAPQISSLITNIAPGLIESAVALVTAVLPVLVSTLIELAPVLVDGVVNLIGFIAENFQTVIGPIIDALPEILSTLLNALIANLPQIIGGLLLLTAYLVVAIPQILGAIWQAIVNAWNQFAAPFFQGIGQVFTKVWEGLKQGAKAAWEGIKGVFSGIANWFGNIFRKAWEAVKKVFSTGGRIFEGIKEGIANVFKTVVNAIIRGINWVIAIPFNAINGFLNTLRGIKILGIQPFGWISTFTVPQIPELAQGGVLERGQVGLLEGTGAEAVVPLEKNTGWIKRVAEELSIEQKEYDVNMDDVVDAIRSMKLYLDGKLLVGGIVGPMDNGLGSRAITAARGVAT
ncbi:MAG: hypothetical protein IJL43_00565 [Lachnospiraceae bacterium]|nr:hypothetical protein [Lachnospiraceae bacterium]